MKFFVPEDEIEERFVRSSGPGGQNVNKVATAVRLRFDVRSSRSLPEEIRERLIRIAGKRMTAGGVLVIEAGRFRTQERNRRDARERLAALVEKASTPARRRVETRAPAAARERRLESKRLQGLRKERRKSVRPSD
jgi:ribosome-associated protein